VKPPYRIFGVELSPYSVKVRSYFRYKRIPHQWVVRNSETMEEFQKLAKLPLVPLVVTPDGDVLQDSTPLIERVEEQHPMPPLQPRDPALAFLSALVEEYADEWVNKPMFHFRWTRDEDQASAAERIAGEMMPSADDARRAAMAAAIRERMVPRLSFVGSSAETAPIIEDSLDRLLGILEAHLESRPFLFGGRPVLADFGLYAQLYQCATDPTPSRRMQERAPRVLGWIERMLEPRSDADLEPWESLQGTLFPLLQDEIGAIFLPWSAANAEAVARGEERFSLELDGKPFSQQTQKYHAKSLKVLRERLAGVRKRQALDPILERAGCLRWLA